MSPEPIQFEQSFPDKKKKAEKPDIDFLSDDQKAAWDSMEEFYHSDDQYFLLAGYAGTGKSTVINLFVEHLIHEYSSKIALTATTNKATRVLREMSPLPETMVEFSTIHSRIGARMYSNEETGIETLHMPKDSKDTLNLFELVGVDEITMMPDKLFDFIHRLIEPSTKMFFVGDPGQLPPVKQSSPAIPMRPDCHKKFKIRPVVLNQIMRQAEENPIIASSMMIRNGPRESLLSSLKENVVDGDIGIFTVPMNDIDNVLEKYYGSENYRKHPNMIRSLAWRVSAVDRMNQRIRRVTISDPEERKKRVCVGDRLMALKPVVETIGRRNTIIWNNNDEFEIMEMQEGSVYTFNEEFQTYHCSVKDLHGTNRTETIQIVGEESIDQYNELLERLYNTAERAKRGKGSAKRHWKNYYTFRDTWASVTHIHSLTVHRSQGSTFGTVILDINDILQSNIPKRKILYTAITRASHQVIIAT